MSKGKKPHESYDIAAVRAAIFGRHEEILVNVCGWPREILDGKHHPCPLCGGTDRFRYFADGSGGCICNQCHTKNNGDIFATVQWRFGKDFGFSLKTICDYAGILPSANGHAKINRLFAT